MTRLLNNPRNSGFENLVLAAIASLWFWTPATLSASSIVVATNIASEARGSESASGTVRSALSRQRAAMGFQRSEGNATTESTVASGQAAGFVAKLQSSGAESTKAIEALVELGPLGIPALYRRMAQMAHLDYPLRGSTEQNAFVNITLTLGLLVRRNPEQSVSWLLSTLMGYTPGTAERRMLAEVTGGALADNPRTIPAAFSFLVTAINNGAVDKELQTTFTVVLRMMCEVDQRYADPIVEASRAALKDLTAVRGKGVLLGQMANLSHLSGKVVPTLEHLYLTERNAETRRQISAALQFARENAAR